MDEAARPHEHGPKRIRRSLAGFYAGERFPNPDSDDGRFVYDVILSTRGWDREMFRQASPEFTFAARFALFAERAAPALAELEAIQNQPVTADMSPEYRGALARNKIQAAKDIPAFRALLYPEDD